MATKEVKEYVEKELPYKILMKLYEDSRASLRELGRELGISYHVVNSVRRGLESEYRIAYTLDIDETKLGFTGGKIITIKFGTKPTIDYIKERIGRNIFVQDAYLAEGDFDLLLYVVGLSRSDFEHWQWKLRSDLGNHKPVLKFAEANNNSIGFFPLKSELLKESEALSATEKKVLALLNDNSRMKLKDLAAKTKSSPNRVIYIMKKLVREGVIRKFSALTQDPDKKLVMAYGTSLTPPPEPGHDRLLKAFLTELVNEDLHEEINDYAATVETSGAWDIFDICAFADGEVLSKRGSELRSSAWAPEDPKTERAILTAVIAGKWPFHLEDYVQPRILLKGLRER